MNHFTEAVCGADVAFATGDIPAVLGILAPDVRWTEAEGGPCGGTYVGPDAVLQNVFGILGTEAAAPMRPMQSTTH